MITLHTKLWITAAVFAVCTASVGFASWLGEHDRRIKAESDATAQKAIASKADEVAKQLQQADKERRLQTDADVAKVRDDAAKQISAAQIAAWIPKQIPNAPQPLTINIPPATAANPKPDAIATIPQADLAPLRDYISKCQVDTVQLTACNADVISRDAQLKTAGEKLSAVERERDAYEQALKGGTFWQRTKKAAKWLAFGAVAGGVALCGSGHCK